MSREEIDKARKDREMFIEEITLTIKHFMKYCQSSNVQPHVGLGTIVSGMYTELVKVLVTSEEAGKLVGRDKVTEPLLDIFYDCNNLMLKELDRVRDNRCT